MRNILNVGPSKEQILQVHNILCITDLREVLENFTNTKDY